MRKYLDLKTILIVILLPEIFFSQTTTWTGNSNTTWSRDQNWTNGYPTINMDAVIPSGLARYPNFFLSSGSCKSLMINSGATVNVGLFSTLTIGNGGISGSGKLITGVLSTINIAGNLKLDSLDLNLVSFINLNGTETQSINSYTIPWLTVNNENGLILNGELTISINLTLTAGTINLQSYNLISASISGNFSSSNMIITSGTGEIRKLFTSAGSFNFPVGDNTGPADYSPVEIELQNGTFSDGAYVGVRVVNSKHTSNHSIQHYLNKCWHLTSSGISDFSYNITLNYVNPDISGTESLIYGGLFNDFGWNLLNQVNTANNQIIAENLTSFGIYTGGEAGAVPVELTSFKARVTLNEISLYWNTATEIKNYGFDIERKKIAVSYENNFSLQQNWLKIGFVPGNGSSNSPKLYSFVDNSQKPTGKYLYRLKQIDTDGSFEYSEAVEIELKRPSGFKLEQNYPNPFNPATTIKYNLPEDSELNITVYNSIGQKTDILFSGIKESGYHSILWNAEDSPAGIYFLRMEAVSRESSGIFKEVKKLILLK